MSPGKSHPYRKLTLPNNAPFELRSSPGKGWGAFATRTINQGDCVLREAPLLTTAKCFSGPNRITEGELQAMVARLSSDERAQLALLRQDDDKNCKFETILDAFFCNDFTVDGRPGHALQVLGSRFNHSCAPNLVNRPDTSCGQGINFIALSHIPAGTELTFCYKDGGPMFECLTRTERQAVLERECQLECTCHICSAGPEEQAISDKRRRLIRGLYYLIFGTDVVELCHNDMVVSRILVPTEDQILAAYHLDIDEFELQTEELDLVEKEHRIRAAQEFRIPLTTRWIYCALALALIEAEKLTTRELRYRMRWIQDDVEKHLCSEENKGVFESAWETMISSPWAGVRWRNGFVLVSRIFDHADAGDEEGNAVLKHKLLHHREQFGERHVAHEAESGSEPELESESEDARSDDDFEGSDSEMDHVMGRR